MSSSTSNQPRKLNSRDLPAALELSTLAGWNQTAGDWQMLFELAPDGCFGIEIDGRVVSTATLLAYGKTLGWIGMVLTHPEYRHRGLAKALFERVLAQAERLGLQTLKLDATDQGQHLYETYGFKSEQPIERWCRVPSNTTTPTHERIPAPAFHELDRKVFGADRSQLLQKLAARGDGVFDPDAYAMTRAGRRAAYLGPCVAMNETLARRVVKLALSNSGATDWFWDLLPANGNAVLLARECGFSPQRHLIRMFRGPEFRSKDQFVYAIAGFEFG